MNKFHDKEMIWEKTLSDLKESTPKGYTANYYKYYTINKK